MKKLACERRKMISQKWGLAVFCWVMAMLFAPPVSSAAEEQQPRTKMPVRTTMNVDWKVRSGDVVNSGAMTLHCNGTARLNEQWSMMDKSAPAGSFVT